MVERVAEAAQSQMTSSGAWLRGAVLQRLKQEQRVEDVRAGSSVS
jgi:hypothetical protein